jgi:hypothetical protein
VLEALTAKSASEGRYLLRARIPCFGVSGQPRYAHGHMAVRRILCRVIDGDPGSARGTPPQLRDPKAARVSGCTNGAGTPSSSSCWADKGFGSRCVYVASAVALPQPRHRLSMRRNSLELTRIVCKFRPWCRIENFRLYKPSRNSRDLKLRSVQAGANSQFLRSEQAATTRLCFGFHAGRCPAET